MVGGTKRPPQDSESGPWSHEQSNTKSNSNTKTFYEEERQNPSRVHVSLDNADTVIEGAPHIAHFAQCGFRHHRNASGTERPFPIFPNFIKRGTYTRANFTSVREKSCPLNSSDSPLVFASA
jgi:hypothetical protein